MQKNYTESTNLILKAYKKLFTLWHCPFKNRQIEIKKIIICKHFQEDEADENFDYGTRGGGAATDGDEGEGDEGHDEDEDSTGLTQGKSRGILDIQSTESVFVNVYTAQESIPTNRFLQPMWPGTGTGTGPSGWESIPGLLKGAQA